MSMNNLNCTLKLFILIIKISKINLLTLFIRTRRLNIHLNGMNFTLYKKIFTHTVIITSSTMNVFRLFSKDGGDRLPTSGCHPRIFMLFEERHLSGLNK